MILYKLIGYNPIDGIYRDPNSGLVENLPDIAFVVSDTIPQNYEEFDSPENWSKFGNMFLGSIYGLKDYLSLRYQIYTRIESIAGSDYLNYDLLTTEQQSVALIWCNVRIVNSKGLPFYITKCGSQDIANSYIGKHLKDSSKARILRYYNALTIFGYSYLGKMQGIKAESYARKDFLDTTYIDRGVVFISEDEIPGLGDWILGQDVYLTTGLKPRIINEEFTLLNGMTVNDFCDTLIGIINAGEF